MAVAIQNPLVSNDIRRLAPRLRPATARNLKYTNSVDLDDYLSYLKYDRIAQLKLASRVNRLNRQRKTNQASRVCTADSEDGADLARSNAPLPSDSYRNKPRLERQEAFRVTKTVRFSDFVDDDSDLYRLGLLYDDEHDRGSGFNLDAIVHPEPTYAIRPSKRARRSRGDEQFDFVNPSLDLGLSFSSLGGDADIARFLEHEHTEDSAPTGESTRSAGGDEAVPASAGRSIPLHIIYELLANSTHSLEPSPATTDFPDLISDTEGEEDECNEWAVIPNCLDEETSNLADADDGVASPTEAWVILGET